MQYSFFRALAWFKFSQTALCYLETLVEATEPTVDDDFDVVGLDNNDGNKPSDEVIVVETKFYRVAAGPPMIQALARNLERH